MLATLTTIHIAQARQLAGGGVGRGGGGGGRTMMRLTGDETERLGQLGQFAGIGHFATRWWRQCWWQRHAVTGGHMIIPDDTGGQQY